MKVYYFAKDLGDTDYDRDDWDQVTLAILFDKNRVGSKVIFINDVRDGVLRINSVAMLIEWPYKLPREVLRRFIPACFEEER